MSKICRYCDKEIPHGEEVKTYGYWSVKAPLPDGSFGNPVHYAHRECKAAGVAAEAWECQNVDADCNDCRHFKRGKLVGSDVFDGHCLKLDKPTIAQPNKCTLHVCFEHRRPDPRMKEAA